MSSVPAAGQTFGAYRLEEILGRGGMGVVYRAVHVHLGRVVALKVLVPELSRSEDFRRRFLRESRLAAALDHPSVVTVYDAGDIDGSLFLAMRMVNGQDLAQTLRSRGRLEPAEALALLGRVADALDAAHAGGLVHRDVKPGNVLVEGERAYLTDFGLTKETQAETTALTATGVFLGTPDYAAPEQISGSHVDGRADVYALGAMLHECLTGARPFPRDSQVAVLYAQLHEPPPRPSDVLPGLPPPLDDVIGRALAKVPGHRFDTSGELIAAARAALEGQATKPRAVVPAPAPTEADRAPASAPPAASPATPPPATPPPATPATAGPLPSLAPGPPLRPHYTQVRRRRSRLPLYAGLAAAALVAAVAVATFAGGGDDAGDSTSGGEGSGGGGGVRSARAVGEPLPVGERPFGIRLADGQLWVANNSEDTVTRMDTDGGNSREIRVGPQPFGLAASDGAVWVVETDTDSVRRIDTATGEATSADVGDEPYFAAAEGDSVYVSSGGDGTVTVLDAKSGRRRGDPIEVGGALRGIAAADGAVWVADRENDVVKRIRDGSVDRTVPVGRNPVQVAIGGGAVWVANKESDSVSRIDPETGAVRTTRVGDEPFGVAYGEGFAWVTSGGDNTVTRLDPDTGRRSGRRVRVPGQPTGITVGDGSVWVTANDAGSVTRIDPGS